MSPEACERLRAICPRFFAQASPSDFSHEDGWEEVLARFGAACEPTAAVFSSSKEKFGTLCVFLDGVVSPEVLKAEEQAIDESSRTCELCGAPGSLVSRARIRTLCDAHQVMST
jgi:hypothetical protein